MTNPTAAMLVIGDEILSGRTRDANMHHLATVLGETGIDLREVRVIGDDAEVIVSAVRELSGHFDHVFTSGGIGPTHDDITADCVARAMGASIGVREDARRILESHYAGKNLELTEARLRMARIPEGATLIENPVSAAPGFSLGNVHVMAGVPDIFQAMLASLMPALIGGTPLTTVSVRVNRGEGDLAGPLGDLARAYPDLSFGSYPFVDKGLHGAELLIRGTDKLQLTEAEARLRSLFSDALA